MEIVDRIRILREKLFSGNLTRMSISVGISRQILSDVLHGNANVSENLKSKLVKKLKINRNWLENGVGQMIEDSNQSSTSILPNVDKLTITEMREIVTWYEQNIGTIKKLLDSIDK